MRRILLVALTLILSLTYVSGQSDQQIQTAVQKALRAYSLTTTLSSVQDGFVTLTGWVVMCRDRLLAVETVNRIHGVKGVDDRIDVSGPNIPNAQLKAQIDGIIKDRIRDLGGFGFGSISAHVQDGVVTLSGAAATELTVPTIDKIAGVVGVKNLIDHVLRVPRYENQWPSTIKVKVQYQ